VIDSEPWSNYVPKNLVWFRDQPVVVMRQLPDSRTMDPFWTQTLKSATGRPRLLPLDETLDPGDSWQPAGFIFHMMRCGSTVVSRMLGSVPHYRVLSEPDVFWQLLTGPIPSREQRTSLIRRLLGLHSAFLCGMREPLFVKWALTSGRFIEEIEAAYPQVPKVFIYRDPVEVLVSCVEGAPHFSQKPRPWMLAPHLVPQGGPNLGPPSGELMARYIASACYWAGQARELRLIDYRQLPDVVWTRLPEYFRLVFDSIDLENLRATAYYRAKDRELGARFLPDSNEKQTRADDAVRKWAAQIIEPELKRLIATHPSL